MNEFIFPLKVYTEDTDYAVVSKIIKVGPASLVYDQYLRLTNEPNTLLCKAIVKVACVNKLMQPCALPIDYDYDILTGDLV